MPEATTELKPKDFVTDQDVRWCPGCGDYSILKQVQTIMPTLNIPRENIVFIVRHAFHTTWKRSACTVSTAAPRPSPAA
jgi:pyruvate/2-oxoacid:ferredoxin oxidoreductase beta subunit